MIKKKCSKCGIEKTLDKFYKRNKFHSDSYYYSWCKKCENERGRVYFQKNKKKVVEYYQKNKEKINIVKKEYRKTIQGFYTTLKGHTKQKNLLICSKIEFLKWYKEQPKKCYYCNLPIEKIGLCFKMTKLPKKWENNKFQIDRKNPKKDYTINNIVLACPICNFIKRDIFSSKEMKNIAQKCIKPKWQRYVR